MSTPISPHLTRSRVVQASEQAIRTIATRGFSLTPPLYTVFFAYAMGSPPEIRQAIDAADLMGEALEEEALLVLYQQYLSEPAQQSEIVGYSAPIVENVVDHLFGTLEKLREENTRHVSDLIGHIQRLDHTPLSEVELRSFAESAVETAMMLQADSDALAEALSASRSEIDELRRDLALRTQESQRDFLTGAYNRKAWDERLASELAKPVRFAPLSVALIDIDHFKRINDQFGHAAGDEVIRRVARTILDSIKGKDMLARYGGEEFALLLPDTPKEGALAVSEAIRRQIAAIWREAEAGGLVCGEVTVSIGVTCLPAQQPSEAAALVAIADSALYQAKHEGRNRVVWRDVPNL